MNLYAAYGSNLNKDQMLKRCPKSEPIGTIVLDKFRLTFKGVADMEKNKNSKIFLGIYKISQKCEIALDGYEEFPNIYKKYYFNYTMKGKKQKLMYYAMNKSFDYAVPSKKYFNVIKNGFKDWGFDINNLIEAGFHSLENNSENGYKSKNWYNQNFITNDFLNAIK
tara:strand:- start:38 stop:535 length:498 start_codon:yes stop_codon:yes gene_type:complete